MTQRNPNKKIELQGVRFVQEVVQENHSIFRDFSGDDQGNDCYVEFVQNGFATNYGVFLQIKSGKTYKDSLGYKVKADQPHLKYWSQGLNLTILVVFDPEIKKAFWVDVTTYLNNNPHVLLHSSHTIRVDKFQEFSIETFSAFLLYCIKFREILSSYEKYGRALEWFANLQNPDICYEGLKALYSNHREKPSTWFYIISTFSKIDQEGIRRNILGLISNYFNPDIFWHVGNIEYFQSEELCAQLSFLLTKCFSKRDIELALYYMEDGITKGSFSYLVFLIINAIDDVHEILKDIAFESNIDNSKRNFCFWLYIQIAKFHSIKETIKTTNEYLNKFPCGEDDEAILGVKESIEQGELWPLG
ncbi:MAG TPA: DUF4365 domain-containing protein [Chitinophagaceae bacterium]|nr:DUF4365 domain-containing protein [Chitinophagaceae bacterium]